MTQSVYRSFTQRLLLLMLMMVMSIGNVWGDLIFQPQSTYPAAVSTQFLVGDDNKVTIDGSSLFASTGIVSNENATFYVRLQLKNASDEGVSFTNFSVKDAWSNDQTGSYIDVTTNGRIAYTTGYPGTGYLNGRNFSFTLPNDHTGYKLYVYVSTKASTSWNQYDSNSDQEPEITNVFECSFITEAEATFTPATESLSETQIDIPYSTSAVSLDLYTDYMSDIQTKLGNQYLYNFYCRWYLRDVNTKAIVDMNSTTFGNYSSVIGYSYAGGNIGNDIGLVWSSNGLSGENRLSQYESYVGTGDAIRQAVLKNVTWTSPNTDYEVVCVMSATEPTMAGSKVWKEPTLQAKYVFHMEAADNFESTLKTGGKTAASIKEHDNAETSSATVDFSKVLNALGGTPKYARFILKKNGAVVDPTGILTITGVTPAIQTTSKPKQGFYLYNSGEELSTSGITVTVNAPDYSDYQVICMLSKDAATAATENVVTQEPEWDLEYTYTFEKVETIPFANLSNEYLQLNKHSEVLSYFGKTEDEIKDSWYGRWSIRNKESGVMQPLKMGNTQAEGSWSVYASVNSNYEEGGYLGNAISGNYVVNNSGTELLYGATSADRAHRSIGYLQVYAPTALVTMKDASDYEIVYEVTDEYTSGTPDFKLRYVFKIPAFENEPNTGMTEDTKPQVIANRSADSFTLGDMPSDAKYARFYLMDRNNNIIEPGTILSVTGGTACAKTESGIYLYNDGSILSPTVTIAAPNTYKLYKVVGLFSTALDEINATGTTVNHEPKWDMKYTYTFDYTISTYEQTPKVEWNATAMEADATDADIDANWKTSLAELAAGQTIKWWVKDGSDNVQPLVLGFSRQVGKWSIGLPTGFTVTSNVATLSGVTSVDESRLRSWVKTRIYAPADATYAEVANYNVVCEVYTNNAGTGAPNARYTFSLTKDFPGSNKSTITSSSKREMLEEDAKTCTLSEVEIPAGTKYARFYLTDGNGNTVSPTGKLTVSDSKSVTVSGYENYGLYLYNESGISSSPTVTLTLENAELNQYKVVMVTSTDKAVLSGTDVISEPDYDTRKTWTFKYPTHFHEASASMEWNPGSMTVPAVDIVSLKGSEYLNNIKSSYYIKWTVVDGSDVQQPLTSGSSRQDDTWTFNGTPYTVINNAATVSNNNNLSTTNWNIWCAPKLYAPKNKTYNELKDCKVICQLYENDTEDAASLALTYTVSLAHSKFTGDLKDGGIEGHLTVEDVAEDAMSVDVPLSYALTAFGNTAKYARIWLTDKNGVAQDDQSKLTVAGATAFPSGIDAKNGYYISNDAGVTFSTAALSAAAGTFNQYQVRIALSTDEGYTPSPSNLEPDYDFLYIIDFAYATKGNVIHKNIKADAEQSKSIEITESEFLSNLGKSELSELNDNFYMRWYVLDKNGDPVNIWCKAYYGIQSEEVNFAFTGSDNAGSPFKVSSQNIYLYPAQLTAKITTFSAAFAANKLNNPTVWVPQSHTFSDYKGYQIVCVTSAVNPTVSSDVITDPDKENCVTYIFHIDDGYSAKSAELTTGMTVKREHNSKLTAELDLATSEHFVDVNGKFGYHLNDETNVEKLYIRWYLADKTGAFVETPAGVTFTPLYAGYADKVVGGTNFGKVLHLGNAGAVVTEDMLKMNVEVTDGDIDLNEYQVVCALGYADDGYTTEPSPLKVKYVYNFETSFEGKLASGIDPHTKEIIVNSDQTEVTIPIDTYFDEILTDLGVTAEDLGKSLHIRWYVMRGDERYVRSDLQLEAVDGDAGYRKHTGVSSSTDPENGSLYWNTATCGIANPLLKDKLNVKFTIPAIDKLWENYKVIAVLTKDLTGQELSGGELTKEPQVLNVQYIFSMIDSKFKFVHHKGASERDYFTHDDDVHITAQSGDYTMNQTTVFLPSDLNVIGGRGDGFFVSDRYTLSSAKQSNIDPATGEPLSKGANDMYPKFGGLTVKKDNPLKTAKFKITGVSAVTGYLVSTNKKESRTCFATATATDGSGVVAASGTSEHEGLAAVITLTLNPAKEYVVDFSDSRKTGTEKGADLSLLGVRFNIDGTEPVVYVPKQLVQYTWDNENSRINIAERPDIRQSVHTVHYYMYIKPSDDPTKSKMLRLPFQRYEGSGNNLEPMAYIRWYDWTADMSSKRIKKVGKLLRELNDEAGNRGLFMLNNSVPNLQPCHENVGVEYYPSGLNKDGDVIACDVSKYYDGLYPGTEDDDREGFGGLKYPHLVHEPTISTRYLFHVFPSSVIVKDIKEGADRFTAALSGLTKENFAERKKTMFNLYENNGRVIVSLNGSAGDFALRAQLQTLGEYYVYNGTEEGTQCSQIRWTAYLEDENGLWERTGNLTPKSTVGRVYSFDISKLNGTYSHVTGSLGSKDITAAPGMRFHIIGYIGDGTSEAAAIHYELQPLDAPAILVENLGATDVKRTYEYLNLHYLEGGIVNFDNYFSDLSEPTTEEGNMLWKPLEWREAQYGFCYPSIDKYRIRTSWSGLTPIHGDYMLLKSMGRDGVSKKGSDNGNTPAAGCKYSYWWYNEPSEVLYDCTHLGNNSKYGGYMYVDASDESRNIATIDFSASLCSGSQMYFTAAIADVTEGGKTSPQLMARVFAKNEFGEKTLVMSFLTSVLNTVNKGDGGYKNNKWYQVYGYGNTPENFDITNYTDFSVEIDNYSRDTEGADFCVDQIVFYTSTGKIQVEQTGGECEDQNLSVTAMMDVENLENMVTLSDTPTTIYYKLFKITGKNQYGIISFEPCDDPSLYENGGKSYGQADIRKYVLKADGTLDDSTADIIERNGRYVIRDGILYAKLIDNKVLNLPQGNDYFIALTKNLQAPDVTKWADPNNVCEVFSKFFLPKKTYAHFLALDGDHHVVSQTVQSACGQSTAHVEYYIQANIPDESEPSGFKSLPYGTDGSIADDGVLFDYFLGTKEQMRENYGSYGKSVLEALQKYREYERTTPTTEYSTTLRADFESVNSVYYNILNDAINKDLLLLRASGKFDYELTKATTTFWALPVNTVYTFDAKNFTVCNYIPFTFTLKSGTSGPEVVLGFDDVDYESAGTKRVLRVGLEQLNKMRTQGYVLHVPVNKFSDKYGTSEGKVYFESDPRLTLASSSDPTATPEVGKTFAKIVPVSAGDPRPCVDRDHMYIALDLTSCGFALHEGYQYEVSTIVFDAEDAGDISTACKGDLFMVIKVVPEFVTWKAQNVDNDGKPTASATDYWSANWYNDGNWQRSTRAELYKDTKGSAQNTATAGHPDGYENNGEGDLSGLNAGNPGFVPMKFTYVTLPTGNHAPSLINEPRVVGTGKGARRQGGGFLDLTRTTLLTDRSPNANTDGMSLSERQNSKPTANIYYDMVVRYGEFHTGDDPEEHYGEGCFGHRYINSSGVWDDQGTADLTAKVFDVEKFQGNVCREIYFKPGAELLRPHRLHYEKAWVEKEMDANKWYLVSVPLKNTYAGDMYVPTSMTDYSLATPAPVAGRQVTEAFQPITFNTTTYSRTRYPIYQRSWGMNNGTVHVKQNDIRANSYSANLSYGTVTTNIAEWGHTYNDVQVSYNALTAFAIRAHKKDQTDKTLIRLPKADTSYEYYDWNEDSPTPAAGTAIKTVGKASIYKLVSDYQDDTDSETSPLKFNISAMQQQGEYVLVGNPFMVSIDMKKFFDYNTELSTDGYWTYEGSNAEAHAVPTTEKTTVIKPLQAFFVKKGTAKAITFNKEMQIDGNHPTPPGWTGGDAKAMTLIAENDKGQSKATILTEEGNDVETLFDSNLDDVPMVYIAPDGKALSILHSSLFTPLSFGVTCSTDDAVDVTLSGLDAIGENSLYVVDAVDGRATKIEENISVSILPNEYGRYFITNTNSLGETEDDVTGDIRVSVHHGMVTVTASRNLGTVRALGINGATVYSAEDCGTTTTFALHRGIYVVEANGEAGNKRVKIAVK